jgi:hypothetical protein
LILTPYNSLELGLSFSAYGNLSEDDQRDCKNAPKFRAVFIDALELPTPNTAHPSTKPGAGFTWACGYLCDRHFNLFANAFW